MVTEKESRLRSYLDYIEWLEVAIVFVWYITGWSPNLIHHKHSKTLLSDVTITAYRPVKKQTDASPNWTSIGMPSIQGNCAVSQDLLSNGTVNYGDLLDTPLGVFKVHDCMNQRYKQHIDILVYTHSQEKLVGWRKHQSIQIITHHEN